MAEHSSNDDPDIDLLHGLQSAEDLDRTFQQLYARYRRRLLAFFSKRGFDRETGHELSQEAFLRVYRSRDRFRGDVPLASWIFQIAANLAKNELRTRQTQKRRGFEKSLDDVEEHQPIEVHSGGVTAASTDDARPLAQTLAREQMNFLARSLNDLPPKMRRTLQLSIYHQYRVAQIASIMKVTESTVKVQLHQGRRRLRKALAQRFGELPF